MHQCVILVLFLLLGVSSCIGDPPCENLPREENIEISFIWPDTLSRRPTVYVDCYPQMGGVPIRNFFPSSGGTFFLPKGDYELLAYSNASSNIRFEDLNTFLGAKAYTDTGVQPDELFSGSIEGLKIKGASSKQRIEVEMKSRVHSFPFRYRGITGLQYVNGIRVQVSGVTLAITMGNGGLLPQTHTVNCAYTLTADGFYGNLRCFGHGDSDSKHSFFVRFEYGGKSRDYVYDVTDMLNRNGYIDINDSLVFEPLAGGGIDTGVGDWEDDAVDIPIN